MKPKSGATPDPIIRVTARIRQSLWDAVQHRAIDEHISTSQLAAKALTLYLKGGRS